MMVCRKRSVLLLYAVRGAEIDSQHGLRRVLTLPHKLLREYPVPSLLVRRVCRVHRVELDALYLLRRRHGLLKRLCPIPVHQLFQPYPRIAVVLRRRVPAPRQIHQVLHQPVRKLLRALHRVSRHHFGVWVIRAVRRGRHAYPVRHFFSPSAAPPPRRSLPPPLPAAP